MTFSNQSRTLTDVVTLDAWQKPSSKGRGLWDIFADISFQTARIGSDPATPIRFRLSLRRAEIHLYMPESDTSLMIIGESVAREPGGRGSRKQKTSGERRQENETGAAAGLDLKALFASVKSRFSVNKRRVQSSLVETEEDVFRMNVYGNRLSPSHARWVVEAAYGEKLDQLPWDVDIPRAVVLDRKHGSRNDGMEAGGIRFEITCRREDLIIESIEFKDNDQLKRLSKDKARAAKYAAITQYIKIELQKNSLNGVHIDDPYGHVQLADFLLSNSDVQEDK